MKSVNSRSSGIMGTLFQEKNMLLLKTQKNMFNVLSPK